MSMQRKYRAETEGPRGAYEHLGDLVLDISEILRPPERLTPSEAAARYRHLNNPGSYVGPWKNEVTQYMVEPVDLLSSREYGAIVFVGPAQCGKALAVDTPIATTGGWKAMGELQPGDYVFSLDGRPTQVTHVSPVMHERECYRVAFDDAQEIVADADHLWTVTDATTLGQVTLTTAEILRSYKTPRGRNRYSIQVALPVQRETSARLPLDPYVLGVWLGDGHSYSNFLHLNSADTAIVSEIVKRGFDVEVRKVEGANCVTVSVVGLRGILRKVGLLSGGGNRIEKFIPPEYLLSSEKTRRDLLAGLLDTDGTVDLRGRVSFCTTVAALAEQVFELVASLGYKPRCRSKQASFSYKGEKRQGKLAHMVEFTAYRDESPFTLLRHTARLGLREDGREWKTRWRRITAVTPTASVPVRCIAVDHPSHLFLAGRGLIPTHNTDTILLNPIIYGAVCDPMDMLVYQTSQTMAADFSRRRIDRMIRQNDCLNTRLLGGASADTTFNKVFRSGMMVTLSWPTINELSGRPVGRVFLTDYDRMPQDIDGEGSPFDLARKRTTTFGRVGKTFVESSPGFPQKDPQWQARSPHEAPPAEGILALYNRGDRRRWYWQCRNCGEWFEPCFALISYPDIPNPVEAGEQATLECPHCAHQHQQRERYDLNVRGRWLRDGLRLDRDGREVGTPAYSDIASFWLKGPAAAFCSWSTLVKNYLLAVQEYDRTGSQEALKATVNTDQGEPYLYRGSQESRTPEVFSSRAVDSVHGDVADDVRFLVANVDVQKNRFVVQVHGVRPGNPYRLVVVDRYDIAKSLRVDEDGDRLPLAPHAYPEDWDLLEHEVMARRYVVREGGRTGTLGIAMTTCDSAGRDGVTANAYAYFRRCKARGLSARFWLTKGAREADAPRARVVTPDSDRKDRHAKARGEIPVLMLNPNVLKDQLDGMLLREDAVEFPDWLSPEFYAELCAEIRTPKGWINPRDARNETWDLLYNCLGLLHHMRVDRVDWRNPPAWMLPGASVVWDQPDAPARQEPAVKSSRSWGDFGRALA